MHTALALAASNPRCDLDALEWLASTGTIDPLCGKTKSLILKIEDSRYQHVGEETPLADIISKKFCHCETFRMFLSNKLLNITNEQTLNPYNPIERNWVVIAKKIEPELPHSILQDLLK